MRRKPKNPKTEPDDFDPMKWQIRKMDQHGKPPVPSDPDEWCLMQSTALWKLGIKEPESRKQVRCPYCTRRLLPSAAHCVGGEFVCWLLPAHKKPPKKKAKVKRKDRGTRYGPRRG